MTTTVDNRHFQIRHRYYDVACDRWVTADLLGPYTMANAIQKANQILMLYSSDDKAYVAIEDMRKPTSSLFNDARLNDDICGMVSLLGTEAYHNFFTKG